MATDQYELLREKFRPKRTRVLFVGESRPANGTFFYCGDSNLARYTCEAFLPEDAVLPAMDDFLRLFMESGCYLVDLCAEPVNQRSAQEREIAREAGVATLGETIRELQPEAIIVVMMAIVPNVEHSVAIAGRTGVPMHVLPFPAQGHQRQYVEGLRAIVEELRANPPGSSGGHEL